MEKKMMLRSGFENLTEAHFWNSSKNNKFSAYLKNKIFLRVKKLRCVPKIQKAGNNLNMLYRYKEEV